MKVMKNHIKISADCPLVNDTFDWEKILVKVQRADFTCDVTSIRLRWFVPWPISNKYSNFAPVTWHVSYRITTLSEICANQVRIKGILVQGCMSWLLGYYRSQLTQPRTTSLHIIFSLNINFIEHEEWDSFQIAC